MKVVFFSEASEVGETFKDHITRGKKGTEIAPWFGFYCFIF